MPASVKPGPKRDKALRHPRGEARTRTKGDPGPAQSAASPRPEGSRIEDVLVEGPGTWSFGKPRHEPAAGRKRSSAFRSRINERPKGQLRPIHAVLRPCAVKSPKPVETRLELDIPVAQAVIPWAGGRSVRRLHGEQPQ